MSVNTRSADLSVRETHRNRTPLDLATLQSTGRCLVMGILNVTPDSFSDGGAYVQSAKAIAHGLQLAAEGSDIIDVGGESTRPGAHRVDSLDELDRVIPVVRELADAGLLVSVDTMRASVAAAAVEAGARIVNDVSGGLADASMAACVAELGVPYVVMHWRAPSARMQAHAVYRDVVGEVVEELGMRLDDLVSRGVDPEQLIVDPGLGFAKTAEQSWQVLGHLDALDGLGRPVLVGASRKSFLEPLSVSTSRDTTFAHRDRATAAISAIAAARGAFCLRVHDVVSTGAAVRVAAAMNPATADALSTREATEPTSKET